MKLLIIRHGDPDYSIDSLTDKGWREAECLSQKLTQMEIKDFYVSPLGRAKDTASCTLKRLGREAEVKEWLREFSPRILRPDRPEKRNVAWAWLPQDWTAREEFLAYDEWQDNDVMKEGRVKAEYDWVTSEFDKVLAEHGYVRNGLLYRVEKPNNDTLAFFCHLGVESVLLSHLLNISPMVLWHGTCALPSSVTTLNTEERRQGTASFRMASFGDLSHLYANGEKASFAARFCECYDNEGERRD